MSESKDSAGHRARLRQRFERAGFAGMAEHEVVELLLTLCIPRRDVKPLAKVLLRRFGSLRGILDASAESLRAVEGVGEVTPVALQVVREVGALYQQQRAEGREVLNGVERLVAFWSPRLGGLCHEVFEVAYLDSGLRLMKDGVQRLQEGTVDRAAVYPREVMAAALRRGASAIVVAHNHPGGGLEPSDHDVRLTQMLVKAAEPLGIRVLEHLIISPEGYYSFRRNNRI